MKYDIDLENDDGFETNKFWTGTKKLFLFIVITILIATGAIILVVYLSNQTTELKASMRIENLMGHLENLRDIAIKNGGTRTTGPGFNASIDYVYDKLKEETDHLLEIQVFNLSTYRLTSAPELHFIDPFQTTYVYSKDFSVFSYSGNGNVTSKLHHVDNRGCDVSDWENFPEGYIALVRRGSCTFNQKIENGKNSQASGMIIYNSGENGDTGLFTGNIGYQTLAPFPIISVSYSLGTSFETFPDADVNIFVQGEVQHTYTRNLIAETKNGNGNKIIVVGSHLDSVPAGPGINDNGSGSSLNLELAIQTFKYLKNPKQKIRFIWFGAEELGLLGSTYYVNSIVEERQNIVLNLNFDMVASPNYQRGIYNGSASDPSIVKASTEIQKLFETFFTIKNLSYIAVPFNGRSDYGPFIEVGIPAGGLFTGAEVIKDDQSRKMFGGLGNTAFDPCYHKDCDTIDNINQEVFIQNAEAAAYVLQNLATNKDIEKFLRGGEAERWSSQMREWRKVKNHIKNINDM